VDRDAALLGAVEASLARVSEDDLVLSRRKVDRFDGARARRVALSAASFTRLARSAPEKPGVFCAMS